MFLWLCQWGIMMHWLNIYPRIVSIEHLTSKIQLNKALWGNHNILFLPCFHDFTLVHIGENLLKLYLKKKTTENLKCVIITVMLRCAQRGIIDVVYFFWDLSMVLFRRFQGHSGLSCTQEVLRIFTKFFIFLIWTSNVVCVLECNQSCQMGRA